MLKNFFVCNFANFCNELVFVLGKLIQYSLMFADKVRSLPKSEAPEKYFPYVGSGLTLKH
jgi:hypothetical protein